MTRRSRLIAVLVAVAAEQALVLGRPPVQDQQPEIPTFRASVNAVQISVIVTDAAGNPVTGLTRDDFEIFENREERSITTFTAVNIPIERVDPDKPEADVLTNDRPPGRVYIIAFDDMGPVEALRSREFLRQFIERYFGPNDSAAVVLTTRGPGDSGHEFTSNPRLLLSAIDRFSGGEANDSEWLREKNFMGDFRALVKVLATLPAARKALILVSSSIPGDAARLRQVRGTAIGRMFQGDINLEFHEAVSLATRNNIAVYPIDPRGRSVDAIDITVDSSDPVGRSLESTIDARTSLEELAHMTGGFALTNSNGFDAAFQRLVRENSTYYVLGFNSADDRRTGQYTRLEVRVKRPGLQVRSVEGYLGPVGAPERIRRPRTVMAAAWDAVASPMTASGVNLRIFAAPYKSKQKEATVAIALEIGTNRLTLTEDNGIYKGEMDILFAVTDVKNRRYPVWRHRAVLALKQDTYERKRAVRLLSQLRLEKGRYQIRASAGGETFGGSVVYDLEIPDFKDDFSLSGVSLSSAQAGETPTVTAQGWIDVGFPGPPTTAREFAADDTLTIFAEAYENRRKRHAVTFTIELRDSAGRVVDRLHEERASVEKPREASVYVFTPRLPLDDVAPGQYVLHLEAKSSLSKKAAVRDVSITVR